MKKIIALLTVFMLVLCSSATVFAGGEISDAPFFEIGFDTDRIECDTNTAFEESFAWYKPEIKTLYLNGITAQSLYFENIEGRFDIILVDDTVNTFTYGISFDGNDAEFHISGNGTLDMQFNSQYGGSFNISEPLYVHSGKITGTNADVFTNGGSIYIDGGDFDVNGKFTCNAAEDEELFSFTGKKFIFKGENPVAFRHVFGGDINNVAWVKNYSIIDNNGKTLVWGLSDEGDKLIPKNADGTIATYVEILPAGSLSSGKEIIADWAKSDVERAKEKGLVPEALMLLNDFTKDITRAEFSAVAVSLYRSMDGEPAENIAHPFKDLEAVPHEFAGYIETAYNLGLINGISETEFAPASPLTREQASTILCRIYEKLGGEISPATATFADDNEISDWAKKSVYFMADKEILKGMGENTFAPKMNTQAQQAIIIALRMLENLK